MRKATAVVQQCIECGVPRVWLFQGIGGAGAVSDDAVALCRTHGVEVVAGACPLMFLEPVGAAHRFHRFMRRLNGGVGEAVSTTAVTDSG